jgi:DNA-binding HxlR family transcriptional regulator
MSKRTFGQYCGLAHALELVGERWALLIVRDLLRGPKRFTDLRQGLPRIPTNVLSARLKELEESGVVQRRALPRPTGGVGYELTEYGRELEGVVLALGLWGARTMGEPSLDDTLNADSLLLGLQATFRPDAARELRASYELHVGELVVHARVDRGELETGEGPLADPDLVVETTGPLKPLLSGELDPKDAIASGLVRVRGKRALLGRFVDVFQIPPAPVPAAS